jgi:glyoxalase family protein
MNRIEGLHHVTAITGDARANVDFYTRVLGLRLVKKTVNQDDPTVYHLFFGDDEGSPGHDLTFFEYPGARRGRAGDGMVHTVAYRVASPAALGFWAERLGGEGIAVQRGAGHLRFDDPEGLTLELRVEDVPDAPLTAAASDVPAEHALLGFAGVRAYASAPARSAPLLTGPLGFAAPAAGEPTFEARGALRGGWIAYEQPPLDRGVQGGGTVHHVAWAIPLGAERQWDERVRAAGARTSGVVDRFYFRSVYFREPSGVLFELATMGPGFGVDEDPDKLGETVALPPFLEPHRARIEASLTPLDGVGRQRAEVR